jgi:hypothetical protein
VTLAAYASDVNKDIYKCGCEYPNGCNYDHEFDFVCDHCYEAAHPERDILDGEV